MGSDIFTESAVAIEVVDFLRQPPIKKKAVRTNIANILFKHDYIDEEAREVMIKNRDGFIDTFISALSMDTSEYSSGYESDRDHNEFMITTFCKNVDINPEKLPDWSLRIFDSNRESGYDIMTDTLYIMFESFGLFQTVMTDEGKELAETLGTDYINETTWTVHSY
jgi:hypothetical protein